MPANRCTGCGNPPPSVVVAIVPFSNPIHFLLPVMNVFSSLSSLSHADCGSDQGQATVGGNARSAIAIIVRWVAREPSGVDGGAGTHEGQGSVDLSASLTLGVLVCWVASVCRCQGCWACDWVLGWGSSRRAGRGGWRRWLFHR